MKSIKILFLFFISLIFITYKGYSQTNDSISHYSQLIQNPKNKNDLAAAYKFFLNKKDEYSEKGLIKNEIHATQSISDIQWQLGYISESERLNIETLELLSQLEIDEWTTDSKVKTINDLGKIYRHKKDYKEALNIYKDGLKLAKRKSDISIILNNIGYAYLKQNKLQKALEYFNSAYKKAIENKDTLNVARSLDNLGFTKSKLKRNDAKTDLIEALSIRKKANYIPGITHSYENLARHFYSVNDSANTLYYSDKAISLARKTNKLDQTESALRLKIDLGDDSFIGEYIKVRDSIRDMKDTDRNNFNYYVYQYDKKEKDLQKSRLLQERLVYFLIFIILISTFLYFFLKFKHKKDKLKQIYNTETRISRKVHDEVANDVYHVMTKLQSVSNSSDDILDDLENIYTRTRDISKENNTIETDEHFEQLITDLLSSYKNDKVNVITKDISKVKWDSLKEFKKVTLYRVLQELMINMKKHSEATLVVLTFEQSNKKTFINYKDNGLGCKLEKNNGLLNAENRITSINGTITFESEINKGFKAKITI